jgi:threonine dehydrogenase-like Zn-dependent dehydrogenase
MKAVAVFPARKELRVIDHPEPKIESPTQAKLRMLDIGVCGTDKEIARFDYGTPPQGSDYLVIGHESLGRVVEVGPQASSVKVGDLVVTMVRRPCGHAECVACNAGRQDFCFTGDFTERGIKGRHGYMTESVVDDQKFMVVVPPELRDIGVLVEPLTIAEKAIEQLWMIQKRLPWGSPEAPNDPSANTHRALVLGAGPVGLLGAMALRVRGFKTVIYSKGKTPNPRADIAAAIGATYIAAEDVPADKIEDAVGTIDLVYEAVGASTLAFDVLKEIGNNAVFIFTGVPGRKGPMPVDTDLIMRDLVLKNQIVFGTVNAGRISFEDAVKDLTEFVRRWPDAVRKLITGRFPIDQAMSLINGQIDGIKNIVAVGQ